MLVAFRREFVNARNGSLAPGIMDRYSLSQQAFHQVISIEQRRAGRSQKRLLLLMLDLNGLVVVRKEPLPIGKKITSALFPITRETDVIGWYKQNSVIGVLFTEIDVDNLTTITRVITNRVSQTMKKHLSPQHVQDLALSFHLLPEAQERESSPLSVPTVLSSESLVTSAPGARPL